MVLRPRLRPPRPTAAQAPLHLASGAHGRRRRRRESLRERRAATAAGLDRRPAALAPQAAWSAVQAAPTRARESPLSRPSGPGLCSRQSPLPGGLGVRCAPSFLCIFIIFLFPPSSRTNNASERVFCSCIPKAWRRPGEGYDLLARGFGHPPPGLHGGTALRQAKRV